MTKPDRTPKSPKPSETLPQDVFDLNINKLDRHFLEQPKLVIVYGLKLAEARDAMDRAKANLEVSRAEAEQEILKDPEEFGLVKTTVDAIKSAVERHDEVRMAVERHQRRRHEVEVLQAMMTALEHRKRTLEALVQLHGQQYFSSPNVTREQREALEEQTKRAVRSRRMEQDDD